MALHRDDPKVEGNDHIGVLMTDIPSEKECHLSSYHSEVLEAGKGYRGHSIVVILAYLRLAHGVVAGLAHEKLFL